MQVSCPNLYHVQVYTMNQLGELATQLYERKTLYHYQVEIKVMGKANHMMSKAMRLNDDSCMVIQRNYLFALFTKQIPDQVHFYLKRNNPDNSHKI